MSRELMATLSDEQLMSRLASGEAEILGELYVRYESAVKAALGRFATDIAYNEREDLVQDVFLAAHDSAAAYPEGIALRAWLYGVAVKKAQSWRRKTWIRRKLLGRLSGSRLGIAFRTTTSPARRAEARELIAISLSRLPRKQREVLLLHAEGFKGKEIAHILNISHETVRIRLHRARSRLLSVMDKNFLLDALGEEY